MKVWLKRLGLAGFLFFFVKGLLWLGVGALAAGGIIAFGGNDPAPAVAGEGGDAPVGETRP